jgi:hypothetical protein
LSEIQFSHDPNSLIWRPNPGRQEEFLRLPPEFKEAFYGGAVGGGKTEVLLMLPVAKGWYKHPQFMGIIFRRKYPQLEEYIIPRSKEIFPKLGATYNETKHEWKFPAGGIYRFSFLDSNDDAFSHDGSSYNYIAWDELTHFTHFMYAYLFRSSRSKTKDLPAIVRAASNPGNIGHSWVRQYFIEPAREGHRKLYNPESKSFRIFIPSKIKDNPKLLEANPNYINELNLLPEGERKAKIEGDWWAFSGQVFAEFRDVHIDGEPENALHVIDHRSMSIPSYFPKILSIDWGFTHNTAAHWHALTPDNRIITYREYICSKKPIDDWGSDIGRISKIDENIVLTLMDPSAWKTESHGKTIAEQFMSASGMLCEKAINDRLTGKQNMHNMLRWAPRPERYVPKEGFDIEVGNRINRIYGPEEYNKYIALFQPEPPETNTPRWQIFDTCSDVIKTIPLLVYDEKKTEDVAKFNGDDSYDGCRYGLMGADLYLKECQREHTKHQKIAGAHERLANTGDQTSFYIQMAKIERESEESGARFNRYKARRQAIRSRAN